MATLSTGLVYTPLSRSQDKPQVEKQEKNDTANLENVSKAQAYKKPFLNKTKKCFFVGLMILAVAVSVKPALETYVLPVSGQQAAKCVELVLATEERYELTDSQIKRAENCIQQVRRYAQDNEKQLGFAEVNPKIMAMRAKYFPQSAPEEELNLYTVAKKALR